MAVDDKTEDKDKNDDERGERVEREGYIEGRKRAPAKEREKKRERREIYRKWEKKITREGWEGEGVERMKREGVRKI